MRRRIPSFRWFFFIALFCISLFLTLQAHRDTGRFKWQSEIYADGAGYYAYLPVTFLYRFDYDKFPVGIDDSTGCGFVNPVKKKFVYKYTYGVAAMLAPFFGATVLVSEIAGLPLEGGFSDAFHRMADVAAVFYLVVGLFFLGEVLKRYAANPVRYAVLLFIYAGTNLYFYTIRQPLMSHVYSFCIISLYIYAFHIYLEKGSWRNFILVAFSASLAMLIRPVNGIVLLLLLLWNVNSFRAFIDRLQVLLSRRNIATFLVIFFLILLPQILYWHYMFGQPLHYAYEGETFANLATPRLAEIWFAPLNGLFLYNPLWFVFIAGIIRMILRKEKNGLLLLFFFLLASYIIAAWHSWFFGCGYGHRAFIDFLPLFAIPFGVIADRVFRIRTRIPAALMLILVVAMSYYNLRIIYSYSGCFTGSVWDWQRYNRQLIQAGLNKGQSSIYIFTNDFENGTMIRASQFSDSISHSYLMSIRLDNQHRTGCTNLLFFHQFALPFPTHADTRIYVYAPAGNTSGAQMFCWIERKGQVLYRDSCAIDPFVSKARRWYTVSKTFNFAPGMPWDATVSVEIRNPGGARFFADDMKIVFY